MPNLKDTAMKKSVYRLVLMLLAASSLLLTQSTIVYAKKNKITATQQGNSQHQATSATNVTPVSNGNRVALVIGNSSYVGMPLDNPVNDASDMAEKLHSLGFEVIERKNLKLKQIGLTLSEFRNKLKPGAEALVFYAGHGIEIKGENYFPVIDADINVEEDVPNQSIALKQILELLDESKTRLNLVFLDACRNNPYSRRFRSAGIGLGKVEAPSGTLISYATRPGSVAADGYGRNGLYTSKLLKQLESSQPIELALKVVVSEVATDSDGAQEPWLEGVIRGEFCFKTCISGVQQSVPTVDAASIELSFWDSIKSSQNLADFQAYLDKYPNGQFVDLAKNRLKPVVAQPVAEAVKPVPIPTSALVKPASVAVDNWQTIDRYQVKDGLVKDTVTGLMWMRCSLGQIWNGSTCQGEVKKYKWDEAMKQNNSSYAGFNDWRVPTIQELKSLVYCSSGKTIEAKSERASICDGEFVKPTILQVAFPKTPEALTWSSSPYNDRSSWAVSFSAGGEWYFVTSPPISSVRLVRGGQ
jgi:hypothetical protein